MTSKTHAGLGLLTGLTTLYMYPTLDTYITISGAIIGSLMLDLDTAKSNPSQIFPPISKIVDKYTKHRGATHTILPFLLIILYYLFNYYPCLIMGLGALSHTLIDVITLRVGITCKSIGEKIIYNIIWSLNVVIIIFLITPYNSGVLINQIIKLIQSGGIK